MFKKLIMSSFFLCASSLTFATPVLTVAPLYPLTWDYTSGSVTINEHIARTVGNGITFPVKLNDQVSSLIVYTINSQQKIDQSCQHIQIREDGSHHLFFKLDNDKLIHCQYSKN